MPTLFDDEDVLGDPLAALALSLMSRLRATRAVGALADDGGFRVELTKGTVGVKVGARVEVSTAEAMPAALAEIGLGLAVPLRYDGETLGLVALGPRLGGAPYTRSEVGLARSLARATAASLAARRAAADLARANRELGGRAQALRTLFELAQAFGRALDRDAIVSRLAFALMGQLAVRKLAVALYDSAGDALDTVHVRGARADLSVPPRLAALRSPTRLDGALDAEGWRYAIPLCAGDVARGVVLLGEPAGGALDDQKRDFAAALAALAVGALETADRLEERVERERMREEVRLAREVQARLLPEHLPSAPGLDVAAWWRPSRGVSGDTYHVADLGGDRLLVAVADVVGKGIGASLLMATVQAGFRLVEPDLAGAADPVSALASATARLDRLIAASTEPHQFVTLAWAVLDGGTGEVWHVVAGHPPPRHLRASGTVHSLPSGGPLLGVLPGATFQTGTLRLHAGDGLLIYSDGVTEAQDAGGEELEVSGLDRALADAPAAAADLVAHVVAAVEAWSAGAAIEDDDLTLVTIRRA